MKNRFAICAISLDTVSGPDVKCSSSGLHFNVENTLQNVSKINFLSIYLLVLMAKYKTYNLLPIKKITYTRTNG